MNTPSSGLVIAQISPDQKDIEGDKIADASIITDLKRVETMFEEGKPMFIEFYLNGCPPCKAAAPEWHKMIETAKKDTAIVKKNLAIVSIESSMLGTIKNAGLNNIVEEKVTGFPTIGVINNKKFTLYNGAREKDEFLKLVKTISVQGGGGWSKIFGMSTSSKRSHTKRSHSHKRSHTHKHKSRRFRNKNTHRRRRY
jgi:hypothetical protein